MRTVRELLPFIPDAVLQQGADHLEVPLLHVTHDSRHVQPGTIFVALCGEFFDGHDFFPSVINQGAVALIGQKSLEEMSAQNVILPRQIPYLQVGDTRKTLALAAAAFNGFPSQDLTVIGITGTDGKTTTVTILESILMAATQTEDFSSGQVGVVSTIGARICGRSDDTGLHITTPDSPAVQHYLAAMRDAGCRYAIIESTSQGIAQSRVDAIDFDVAAVTNITHEHLDWHGSRSAYIGAKAELFRKLFQPQSHGGSRRWAVLNADDVGTPEHPGSFEALQMVLAEASLADPGCVDMQCYSIEQHNENATVRASNITFHPENTRFDLHHSGGKLALRSPLIGEFNVQNILCAATVALALGIAPHFIQRGVERVKGVIGRMERIDCGQPFLAVVDFAHSPASLQRALLTLRQLLRNSPNGERSNRRIIAVFGSAGLRDKEKRRLMGRVSGQLADFTVITAEDPRTENLDLINKEIAAGVQEFAGADDFIIIPDRASAIQHAIDKAQPGDIVASFGKGHERSMCYGTTEHPWNEQMAVRNALQKRGFQKRDE